MDEIVWEDRPSWKGCYISIILSMVLLTFGGMNILFDLTGNSIINGIMIIIGITIITQTLLKRFTYKYIITPTRIIGDYGIFTTVTIEEDIRFVRSIYLSQNIIQKVLNIGNIEFVTVTGSSNDIHFHNIDNPQSVKELIYQYQERALHAHH